MTPDPKAQALETEIAAIRTRLDGLLRELGRRKRRALDWRYQLQRHSVPLLLGAVALAALAVGGASLAAHRRQQSRRLLARFARVREAAVRAVAHPNRVAPADRTIPGKILAAAGAALAATLVRTAVQRAISSRNNGRAAPQLSAASGT